MCTFLFFYFSVDMRVIFIFVYAYKRQFQMLCHHNSSSAILSRHSSLKNHTYWVWKKLQDKVFSRVEIVSRIGRETTLRHSHRDRIGRWVFRSCGHRKQTCRWFGGLKMESTFSSWYITRNKTFALLRVHTIVTTTRTFFPLYIENVPMYLYTYIEVTLLWIYHERLFTRHHLHESATK